MQSVLGQCVGALNGKQWRVVRSYFDPAYSHNASLVMLPSFQNEVVKWLNMLKNDSLRTGVGRLVVHAPTSCKILPLRVIPQSFYGEAYDDDVSLLLMHGRNRGLTISAGLCKAGSRQPDAGSGAEVCGDWSVAEVSMVQHASDPVEAAVGSVSSRLAGLQPRDAGDCAQGKRETKMA